MPRLGLLGKTILALATVSLIPLAVTPYLLRLNREAMTEQVLRTHALAARTAAARIAAFVQSLRGPAEAVALNPELYGDPRSPAARGLLAGLLQSQPALAGASVSNAEGEEVIRVQNRNRSDTVTEVLGRGSGERTLVHQGPSGIWLRLEAALPEGRGRLWLVADAAALEGIARPEELGDGATLAVVGPGEDLLVSSDPGATLEGFPPGLVAAARAGEVSGSGRFPSGSGDGSDETVLGAHSPIDGTPWYVLSQQPARVAEQVARQMRQRSLLALGVAFFLTGLLSFVSYRFLIRPLRDLARAQWRLARVTVRPRTAGEVEQLKQAFALLEREAGDRDEMGKIFLGRFQVIEVLGAGGMGTVFRGWDPKLQRPVALKTVRLGRAQTDRATLHEMIKSLLKEAVTVARLNHPNIVAVYDVEDTPEAAFVAMEFVDGMSLETFRPAGRPMPAGEIVPIAAGVARGLAAAHAQGVVHRDIKPGNILLGRDGSIKIADFGIAEMMTSVAGGSKMVFGTPGYIAPEVLKGHPYGPAVDLFALGAILYDRLSGIPAFPGRDVSEIVKVTLEQPVPALAERLPAIPEELDWLVSRLLEKDPARRVSSAEAVAEVLEELSSRGSWRWSPVFEEHLPEVEGDEIRVSCLVSTAMVPTHDLSGRGSDTQPAA